MQAGGKDGDAWMMREQGRKGGLLGAAREGRRRRHRAAATLRVRVPMCCVSMHHALLSLSHTPAAAADVRGGSSSRRPTAVRRRAWGDSGGAASTLRVQSDAHLQIVVVVLSGCMQQVLAVASTCKLVAGAVGGLGE